MEENEHVDQLCDYTFYLELSNKILNSLEKKGCVNTFDYVKFKQYAKIEPPINLQISQKLEDSIISKQLKINEEKILSFLNNKNEYEYLSDFFLNSNSQFDFTVNTIDEDQKQTSHNENSLKIDNQIGNNDITINQLKSGNLSLLLGLSSREFLRSTKLEEPYITRIKGEEPNADKPKSDEMKVIENTKPKITSEIITVPKNLRQSLKRNETEISKIDNEVEQEINEEIFSYAKNMKQYARSFNEMLVKDNNKLEKIEKSQDTSKSKTDKSLKSLKEFNYNLTIGFFKLLLMFIIVLVTFFITLISIRIFPKLVNNY